jgi:uncharacterized membrane protein
MYLWLKLIHILAVVMFIGNIVTGVFWHRHARRRARRVAPLTRWLITDCRGSGTSGARSRPGRRSSASR